MKTSVLLLGLCVAVTAINLKVFDGGACAPSASDTGDTGKPATQPDAVPYTTTGLQAIKAKHWAGNMVFKGQGLYMQACKSKGKTEDILVGTIVKGACWSTPVIEAVMACSTDPRVKGTCVMPNKVDPLNAYKALGGTGACSAKSAKPVHCCTLTKKLLASMFKVTAELFEKKYEETDEKMATAVEKMVTADEEHVAAEEKDAATTSDVFELGNGVGVGRRAGSTADAGSFTLASGSNRAGNDEALR